MNMTIVLSRFVVARRMLQDPKGRGVVANFHDQWLHVAEIGFTEKDRAVFPAYTASIAGLMQQETAKFLDNITWEGDEDLGALFTAPFTFVNGPLPNITESRG